MNKLKQMEMLRTLMPPSKPGPTFAYEPGQVEAGQDVVVGNSAYFVGAHNNLIRTSEKKSKTRRHREKVAERKAMERKYNPQGWPTL